MTSTSSRWSWWRGERLVEALFFERQAGAGADGFGDEVGRELGGPGQHRQARIGRGVVAIGHQSHRAHVLGTRRVRTAGRQPSEVDFGPVVGAPSGEIEPLVVVHEGPHIRWKGAELLAVDEAHQQGVFVVGASGDDPLDAGNRVGSMASLRRAWAI